MIFCPFATFATNAGGSPETSVSVGGCRPSRHDFVMIEFLNYEKRTSDSIPNSLSLRQIHEKPALETIFFFKIDLRSIAFSDFGRMVSSEFGLVLERTLIPISISTVTDLQFATPLD